MYIYIYIYIEVCGEYMPAISCAVIHTVLRTVPTVRYCVRYFASQLNSIAKTCIASPLKNKTLNNQHMY